MSKTAADYPVTFPFGATTFPYSKQHPHMGEDRKMPLNTEVWVSKTLIGLAGTTGKSTGVHTHTQKIVSGEVVNPKGGGFNVPLPAVVIETGTLWTNPLKYREIGNFVRIKDAKGVVWSFFHLNKVLVKKGDKIGVKMVTAGQLADLYRWLLGRPISAYGRKHYLNKVTYEEAQAKIKASRTYKALQKAAKQDKLNAEKHLPKELRI